MRASHIFIRRGLAAALQLLCPFQQRKRRLTFGQIGSRPCSADLPLSGEVCGFGRIRRRKAADRSKHGLRYMISSNGVPSFASVDVLNTVALVAEGARVSKVNPAALAFADTPWRTTSPFITRDIHCRRASSRDNDRLVHEGFLGAEILGSMDTATFLEGLAYGERLFLATSILDGHRTACYDIK